MFSRIFETVYFFIIFAKPETMPRVLRHYLCAFVTWVYVYVPARVCTFIACVGFTKNFSRVRSNIRCVWYSNIVYAFETTPQRFHPTRHKARRQRVHKRKRCVTRTCARNVLYVQSTTLAETPHCTSSVHIFIARKNIHSVLAHHVRPYQWLFQRATGKIGSLRRQTEK